MLMMMMIEEFSGSCRDGQSECFGLRAEALRYASISPPSFYQNVFLGVGKRSLGWSIHPNLRLAGLGGCGFKALGFGALGVFVVRGQTFKVPLDTPGLSSSREWGNGSQSLKVPYSSPNKPFPPSLLRTREWRPYATSSAASADWLMPVFSAGQSRKPKAL